MRFAIIVSICVFAACGCRRAQDGRTYPNEAYRIWVESVDEYRTNDWRKAYPMMAKATDELSRMSVSNPKDLIYDPVLAQMNARLFVMAEKNGDAKAAQKYYEKTALYYMRVLKAAHDQPIKYSPEEIRSVVKALDEKLRSPIRP